MNDIAYGYQQQVEVIIAQRQLDARKAEQLRHARRETISITHGLRTRVGGMLVAIGERLNPDARPLPALDPATQA